MDELITKLKSFVASDRFLANVDIDSIIYLLDARDEDPFESEWIRVYKLLETHNLPKDESIDKLREQAYKRVYALSKMPDACGSISDDFGLVADALRAGLDDPWTASLFAAYAAGGLPHGDLQTTPTTLAEAVADLP